MRVTSCCSLEAQKTDANGNVKGEDNVEDLSDEEEDSSNEANEDVAAKAEDNAGDGTDESTESTQLRWIVQIIIRELTQQRRKERKEQCRRHRERGYGRNREHQRRAVRDVNIMQHDVEVPQLTMRMSATRRATTATVTRTPAEVSKSTLISTPTRACNSPMQPVKTILSSSTRGVTDSTVQLSLVM